MAAIRLLIDEDVRPLLAQTLRQRGFDVQHVLELRREGLSDREQLAHAVEHERTLLTHNIRDFVLLDREYQERGDAHAGIVVSAQVPFRELLRRTLRCPSGASRASMPRQPEIASSGSMTTSSPRPVR